MDIQINTVGPTDTELFELGTQDAGIYKHKVHNPVKKAKIMDIVVTVLTRLVFW